MNIKTEIYRRCEIVLHSTKTYENPFMDVDIDAVFTHEDGTVITLPGFWNGEDEWKVRFISEKTGKWTYTVTCTDESNSSLCDSGVIEAIYAEPRNDLEKHGYVTLKEGSRFFTYADGTPFFYLADTHWQMPDYERLHECNYPGCTCGNQFKHVVDDRVKKGFTAYQTYFDSANSDGGGHPYVHLWWEDRTFTKIKPQSFNETMDVMMEYLAEVGLTTSIGFGVHICTIGNYKKAEPLLRFARYCVARYACYPVMWLAGQEITDYRYNSFEYYRQAAELVGKLDGYHRPNGAHMYPLDASEPRAVTLENDPWHQVWFLQTGHGGLDVLRPRQFYEGYYNNTKVKPFIESESHYEDLSGTNGHDASRVSAWQAILSGAAGFTYGAVGVWAIRWSMENTKGWGGGYNTEPWYIGVDKPGSNEMTYLRKFFEYVDWTKLTPSFDHEFGAFEMRKLVAISHIDNDVIVYYFFGTGDEYGTLNGLKKNTRYQVRWYDPTTGNFSDAEDIITETGSCPIPKKPSLRDWVLLLNTYDLGEYEAVPYPVMPKQVSVPEVTLGEEIKVVSVKALSEDPEHPATNMLDGNPDTYWSPLAPGACQTLVFELEKSDDLAYVLFDCANEELSYLRFAIFASNDGENYTFIGERPNKTVLIGKKYTQYIDFLNGKYRYVKLFFNSPLISEAKRKFTRISFYKKAEE